MSFLGEIKRRKVFQVAAVYAVVAWLIIQVVGAINDPLNLPDWLDTVVIVLLAVGFPIAVILAWAFDVTPEGIRATTEPDVGDRRSQPSRATFTYVSQILILLAVGFLILDQYVFVDVRSVSTLDPSSLLSGRPVNRFVHALAADQTLRGTQRPLIAMSPDGRHFVYNTQDGLFLRTLGEFDARLISGTEPDLRSPTFSPDGRSLLYWQSGQLKRIAISGGAPVVVADVAGFPDGVSWDAEGTILFGRPEGILRVSENGGTPELVIPAQEGERVYGPMLLPDGDSILFAVTTSSNCDAGHIVAQSLSTGERKVILESGNDARYLSTGHIVYALGDTLFAVGVDQDRLTVTSGPVALLQGVRRANNTPAAQYSISDDGTLVYFPGGSTSSQSLVWVDQQGREEAIDQLGRRDYVWVRLSPDGSKVVLEIDDGNNRDIWVSELGRGTLERITADPADDRTPVWTPDGERIVFLSRRDGGEGLFVRDADGRGEVEHLFTIEGATNVRLFSWSPDGNKLLFGYYPGDTNAEADIGVVEMSLDGEPSWRPLLVAEGTQGSPVVSPDGNWFAYNSSESGQFEVYVERFPDGGDRRQISIDSGVSPVWSPDGHMLFYRKWIGDGAMMSVELETEPILMPQQPEMLFAGSYAQGVEGRNWDIAPDGRRFLLVTASGSISSSAVAGQQVMIVENWFSELERLVPTD